MSDQTQPSATTQSPDGRSTSFQPVTGEAEHYSGEGLLVSAYALIWVILLSWVALVWRKQSVLDARLDDLEREIARADATSARS
ncbi:MAG TPA: CcmD family protein [Polyangiaceae bacterium]|nr:CcmD family protein [Polyangiaceae bacterium]